MLASRLAFDRRRRLLQRMTDLAAGAAPGPSTVPVQVSEALAAVPLSRLTRLVAEADLPPEVDVLLCSHLVEARGIERLRVDATTGTRNRWSRIAALRVLALGRPAEAREPLAGAIGDPDEEVVAGAVRILGRIGEPWAGALLIDALRSGRYSRSRIATFLDAFPLDLAALVLPLLDDPDPMLRYWGAVLARRYPAVSERLEQVTDDPEPLVRKAALDTCGVIGGAWVPTAARRRLTDPIFYVRAHAARALGKRRHTEAAGEVAALLADPDWRVRYSAKRALEAMGQAAEPAALAQLQSPDRFARNGAAEVLQNLAVLERLVIAEAAGPPDPARGRALVALGEAGGPGMRDAVLARLDPAVRRDARELLLRLGFESPDDGKERLTA